MHRTLYLLLILLMFTDLSAQSDKSTPTKIDLNTYFNTVKYRNIGPFRGGRSNAACGVIGNPFTYYMGTTGGGLWKTEDAGQHWTNISDGYFTSGSIGAVAVAESNPNIIYCGTGEHAVRGVMTHHGDGVYKSIDAGKTWEKTGLENTQHIARIIIHPTNPDIVYVAAQGALFGPTKARGIYKSTDGGSTWKNVLFINENTGCTEISINKNHPHILYAAMWEHQRLPWKIISGGSGSGLYKSTDAGETWTQIHNGLPEEKGKMAVSVCQSNPARLYALVESDSEQEKGGLFVSTNAGESWSRVSKDHRMVQRAWYYTEVFADPTDEYTVYVLSAPALCSIDGGKTWERIRGTHGDFHDLWINPDNPKNMVIANDGGAAITFDQGESWSTQSNMPTAQIYRINVDNHFPYRLYGGQQDNSSIRIASRQVGSWGIYPQSWNPSAGGESAFLAFDPDNPRYVLGGSYLGTIEILDTKANAGTEIMAAPIQYLGEDAKDQRYRYNWNAPIIWSQHEPNTYYHAAQHLLRTRDMGNSWEEVSPDLSKDEEKKQGKPGGPYTNEAVGAENYGTISYVAESPHKKGVIWVGTDDGLVQLTRDGGATWQNVTPKKLPECLINAIDISPHDPGTAYIATTRYKFNDHRPALYKTTDYGKTWTGINKGIPEGAFTRVVREDNQRKDLLFAGTESGIYISWNGGKEWQPFQLNLPVTPITDLMVQHDDLIVATSGRSFWILDDVGLIRQYGQNKDSIILYQPEEALLINGGSELNKTDSEFTGTHPLRGVNPANGAVIYYELPDLKEEDHITLTITDSESKVVRELSSQSDSTFQSYPGGPPSDPTLSKSKGLNRFVWDLRYPTMPGAPEVYIEGSYRGHKVIPGVYTLQLKVGEREITTSLDVNPCPLYEISPTDYQEYHGFMQGMEASLAKMHKMTNTLYDAQNQLASLLGRIPKIEMYQTIHLKGDSLLNELKNWDSEMVQRKTKAYDDVENFQNKFTANYLFLINQTESDIPRVNQSSRDRRKELDAEWEELKTSGKRLLEEQIPVFNKLLWEAGVGAIWLP